jgi:hypothetical protein
MPAFEIGAETVDGAGLVDFEAIAGRSRDGHGCRVHRGPGGPAGRARSMVRTAAMVRVAAGPGMECRRPGVPGVTLEQQIFNLPQRQRIADVHHHREAD